MKRSGLDQVTLASANLVRSEVGQEFLRAMEAFVEETRETLVFAPLDQLAYAQGVARQGTVLLKTLREAPEKAVKILAAEDAAKLKENKK
jgi:hypothetical protein